MLFIRHTRRDTLNEMLVGSAFDTSAQPHTPTLGLARWQRGPRLSILIYSTSVQAPLAPLELRVAAAGLGRARQERVEQMAEPEADEQRDDELVRVQDDRLGAVDAPLRRVEDPPVGPVQRDEHERREPRRAVVKRTRREESPRRAPLRARRARCVRGLRGCAPDGGGGGRRGRRRGRRCGGARDGSRGLRDGERGARSREKTQHDPAEHQRGERALDIVPARASEL